MTDEGDEGKEKDGDNMSKEKEEKSKAAAEREASANNKSDGSDGRVDSEEDRSKGQNVKHVFKSLNSSNVCLMNSLLCYCCYGIFSISSIIIIIVVSAIKSTLSNTFTCGNIVRLSLNVLH